MYVYVCMHVCLYVRDTAAVAAKLLLWSCKAAVDCEAVKLLLLWSCCCGAAKLLWLRSCCCGAAKLLLLWSCEAATAPNPGRGSGWGLDGASHQAQLADAAAAASGRNTPHLSCRGCEAAAAAELRSCCGSQADSRVRLGTCWRKPSSTACCCCGCCFWSQHTSPELPWLRSCCCCGAAKLLRLPG